jgi:hypothetical protein
MSKAITKLDPAAVTHVHNVVRKHMQAAADELGMTLKPANAKYDSTSFTKKIVLELTDSPAVAKKAEVEFNFQAMSVGLDPTLWHRKVKLGNITAEIIGVRPRATKNPVVLKGDDGKQYVAPVSMVTRNLLPKVA